MQLIAMLNTNETHLLEKIMFAIVLRSVVVSDDVKVSFVRKDNRFLLRDSLYFSDSSILIDCFNLKLNQ